MIADMGRQRVDDFARLSQALADAPNETSRLQVGVNAAVALVERCSHAGVTVKEGGGLETRISSDETVRRANELQNELGEGPCLVVMRDQQTLISPDLAEEVRWPRWAAQVRAELGVGSMMSLLIFTDKAAFGALSLYARRGERFDADDVAVAVAVAAQLAFVMDSERQIDQLGIALHSRLIIGQAQGIVMERLGVNAAQAFDYLRRVSSITNVKVVDVAADIVLTRTFQALDRPASGVWSRPGRPCC